MKMLDFIVCTAGPFSNKHGVQNCFWITKICFHISEMSEDFLLKWNDPPSLFFVDAEELCAREEYTDVTLAAGTKFFAAHKLVLSICSPYFRRLFKLLGSDKSVIFLKDVDHRHLDLLLQYMYKGEIKVQVCKRLLLF